MTDEPTPDVHEDEEPAAEMTVADRILAFLDAIETTEIVTADGGDRDVDPDGLGFSGEMLKLIEAIAADENDVWNTAARCALAGPAPAISDRELLDYLEELMKPPTSIELREESDGTMFWCVVNLSGEPISEEYESLREVIAAAMKLAAENQD